MDTLLDKFIKEKLKSYIEPERKGTAKGDPIGLSRVKYEASLFMLSRITYKELAEQLKISHGLVLKWRTEALFKSTLEKHMVEFGILFGKRVLEIASTIDDFTKPENYSNLDLNEFSGQDFSQDLFTLIWAELELLRDKLIEEFNLHILPVVLDVFATFAYTHYFVRLRDQEKADKLMRDAYKLFHTTTVSIMSERITKYVKNLLKKEPFLDDDRQNALLALDSLEHYFKSHVPRWELVKNIE